MCSGAVPLGHSSGMELSSVSQGILLGLWEHQFHRGMEAQLTLGQTQTLLTVPICWLIIQGWLYFQLPQD